MRNRFNLSHEHKTSCDMGQLIPIMAEEVLPGDTFIHRATALCRVAPLQHPLMHRVELRMHTFYVPCRIMWPGDWEDFITGKDEVTPLPTITPSRNSGDILDYMGVPPTYTGELQAFWAHAYNLIYNEFYRDQDLQTERATDDVSLARCAWQKDYFTIARPQPQQGTAEEIPFSAGEIPIKRATTSDGSPIDFRVNAGAEAFAGTGTTAPQRLFADMTDATAGISIDDLRRTVALQRFAEARMRFGSRYVDYLRYLGVNPSDGRLDRPEYLGGGKQVLNFSEVLATNQNTEVNVGDMFGHGIGLASMNGWRKMFEEHGIVMTLLSARPKTVYANMLPRKFRRASAMDYWQKELEILPWQEVNEQEVDATGNENTVFGYVPRYEEYRHSQSMVSSTLRGGTENDWHMAREFGSPPMLNSSFVTCTPTDRVYQDASMPDLVINVMHDLKAARMVGATATMGVDL